MTANIGILYTGGTIGMIDSPQGLIPAPNLARHTQHLFSGSLTADWHISDPLIDSSAVNLTHWQDWLAWIHNALPRYDALLILHGTDTLAYTANILALSLPDLNKPIIITGAQWPFGQRHSDAEFNLRTALAACLLTDLHHCAVAFNGQLYRAVGSTKISTETAAAFDTPHFAPLASWLPEHGQWQKQTANRLPGPQALMPPAWSINPSINPSVRIVCHTLIPGASSEMIAESLNTIPADGAVLQSYGHGNAPDCPQLFAALHRLAERNIPVINISQVLQGKTAGVYAQGHALRETGVINGGKANLETAVALLTLAASNHWTKTEISGCLKYWQLCD
ncbi:asparaginase [Stenoxybacter acetivorans]|uniref:asparaginase n=1 Tax=Stenoxybacter acetivorans TaxID=422441 RepID=UPI00055FBCE5|nr:asparaginase [Stenoxybacter acetivorans]